MHKLMLFLTALTFSAVVNADGPSCQDRYDAAVNVCKELVNICMDVSVCKDIRKKCPQNIGDMASCEEFKQCTRKNTPPIFNSVCKYNWGGHPTGGACENSNGTMERVATTCPGYSLTLSSNDSDFNCMGQINRYTSSKRNCIEAIHYYYQGCATDPSRPTISVKSCDDADHPLPIANDTVTAEAKNNVNVSRAVSNRIHTRKWVQNQRTTSNSGSSAIGQ